MSAASSPFPLSGEILRLHCYAGFCSPCTCRASVSATSRSTKSRAVTSNMPYTGDGWRDMPMEHHATTPPGNGGARRDRQEGGNDEAETATHEVGRQPGLANDRRVRNDQYGERVRHCRSDDGRLVDDVTQAAGPIFGPGQSSFGEIVAYGQALRPQVRDVPNQTANFLAPGEVLE